LNIHHKIIQYSSQEFEYTSQDFEYTSQDIEYISQDYRINITRFRIYITRYRVYITRFRIYITRYWIYITRFSNIATFYTPYWSHLKNYSARKGQIYMEAFWRSACLLKSWYWVSSGATLRVTTFTCVYIGIKNKILFSRTTDRARKVQI
jgi:hypothetical protein